MSTRYSNLCTLRTLARSLSIHQVSPSSTLCRAARAADLEFSVSSVWTQDPARIDSRKIQVTRHPGRVLRGGILMRLRLFDGMRRPRAADRNSQSRKTVTGTGNSNRSAIGLQPSLEATYHAEDLVTLMKRPRKDTVGRRRSECQAVQDSNRRHVVKPVLRPHRHGNDKS